MRTLTGFIKKHAHIVVACVMLAALYAVYSISYSSGLQSLQEEADRSTKEVARVLFVPVEKYSYLPQVIARQPVISDALLHKSQVTYLAKANAYLENINQIAKVEAIYLLNGDGLTIAASNWNRKSSFVGQNYSFRPYFQDAIKGGIGRFYALGTTSKTPGYYIAYPVEGEKQPIGVVVVKVDLSKFDREWQDQNAFEFTITDEYGINFLSSLQDWKYRPLEALTQADIEDLKRTRKYDASLKPPLPILERRNLGAGSQYVKIAQADAIGQEVAVSYVLGTDKLSWSSWNVNIFMPADKVQSAAIMQTLLAAVLLSFILLAGLYWAELRRRDAEREKAKRIIESAYSELDEKHRRLEVLSEELLHLSTVDELTGSYNRRFFFEVAAKMLSAVLRHNLALSVIVIDVDFFKRINDEYGHLAGDKVLKQISQICSADLREEDVFARLGGEEFIMALMPTQEKEAVEIAERLRLQVMEHRFMENGSAIKVTISCGVAQFRPTDLSIESTILRADKALYHAKKSGRNQVVLTDASEDDSLKTARPLPLS